METTKLEIYPGVQSPIASKAVLPPEEEPIPIIIAELRRGSTLRVSIGRAEGKMLGYRILEPQGAVEGVRFKLRVYAG